MKQFRLLDLFCGAGGCTKGYQRSGFHVTGVDCKPQPRYCGEEFIQADALEFVRQHGHEFDAIHASPPCQAYSAGKNMWKGRLPDDRHPDLVGEVRQLLHTTGRPFVIENVVGAPLERPLTLCGDMFGLGVIRHRLFETSFLAWHPESCRPNHPLFTTSVFGGGALSRTPERGWSRGRGNFMQRRTHVPHEQAKAAMGIDWMTRDELSQAIPPAYTEYVGKQIFDLLMAGPEATHA